MGRWWVGLALLGVAGCARQTEFIGRVQTDGAAAADSRRPDVDGGGPVDAPAESPAATCISADPTLPVVPAPEWTCGRERCLKEGSVDPALFAPGAAVDAEPGRRPEIRYPLGGSIHPVNLSHITLQWRRGSPGQTAFRITIAPASGGEAPFELFVPYQPTGASMAQELDASYLVPEAVWRHVARTYAGREVRLRVSAHDPARGIATSDETAIQFSPAAVEGGLYYLETINRRIQRHVFGAARVEAMVSPSTARNLSDCGGCHSLSRNGKTLAFAATYAGNLTIADTSDLDRPTVAPPPPSEAARADAVSPVVSPDGSFVLARDGLEGDLTVYDAAGRVRGGATTAETGGRIDFPEWSPDGREIVATRASLGGQPVKQYSAFDGQLVVMRFSDASFPRPLATPEVVLDEPGEVHAYPSWSPDGQWIVFVSSPVVSGESHNNPSARLRLVRRHTTGQPKVIELGRATLGGAGSRSTFPRFAPTGQQGCQLLFVTFNSRMDYGLLRRNRDAPEGGFEQLWMSAIDLSRLSTGEDPSAPPVWLPFQDINQRNVAATWSEVVPCTSDPGCGAGARCRAGRCVAGD